MKDNAIEIFEAGEVDPRYVEAYNAIKSKEIPVEAIKTHPGKGGKTFSYVDHVWVTETLQDGLKHMWSFNVLSWEVIREQLTISKEKKEVRSVVALCQLILHIPLKDGVSFLNRSVTEVGVFEPNDSMPSAMAIASAVSRGLCRCSMRSLGIGLQFYKDEEPEITSAQAWTTLKQFATNQGARWEEIQEQFLEKLKEVEIGKVNLVDRYAEAYHILAQILGKVTKLEEMPE